MNLRSPLAATGLAAFILALAHGVPAVADAESPPGLAGRPYRDMPAIAPIGVRVDRYLPVPAAGAPRPIDPAKGYRLDTLGRSLYMVTDDFYQSMIMVRDKGVIVVDAPPRYSKRLRAAIADTTDRPVTHIRDQCYAMEQSLRID